MTYEDLENRAWQKEELVLFYDFDEIENLIVKDIRKKDITSAVNILKFSLYCNGSAFLICALQYSNI